MNNDFIITQMINAKYDLTMFMLKEFREIKENHNKLSAKIDFIMSELGINYTSDISIDDLIGRRQPHGKNNTP
jgi:hypothetical protein